MRSERIAVIIPAHNEEASIGRVVSSIPALDVDEIVVVDNKSTDNTAAVARNNGATVLFEPRMGYGFACSTGIEYISQQRMGKRPHIIVFMDGDFADDPRELPLVVEPIIKSGYDLVIGSRVLGRRERGALLPQARFGNALSTFLMKMLYGAPFTDLGPFRALRLDALLALKMQDMTYGWTVEMQIKAAKQKLPYCEVPVSYRKRIGVSKVTGTFKGTFMAGYKILWTIFKLR